MKTKVTTWCEDRNTPVPYDSKLAKKHKPRLYRCSKCKKRFKTIWKECSDLDCWHEYLPKHKVKKWNEKG